MKDAVVPVSTAATCTILLCLALMIGLYAFGIAICGSIFATWIRSAMGFGLSAGFLVVAALMLREASSAGTATPKLSAFAVASVAIFLVILTRGAPHNNPHLYAIFESAGVLGLVGVVGATIVISAILTKAIVHHYQTLSMEKYLCRWFGIAVAALCLFAIGGAADPILNAWDQPSWSDASTYDRIAHAIALGEHPAGKSDYMPVYQFGSGALYWTFGHFFFVPQIVNMILAPVTVLLVALAARLLFVSAGAGLAAGVLAASHDYLRYTPNMMTIENWYVPAVALALYCAARLLVSPSIWKAVILALAVGLVFGIRVQGAFFCAFLVLTPLFSNHLSFRNRLRYCLIAGGVFAATLTPWTIRNMIVDGRMSPGTTQAAGQMIYTTDRRPFYGIRREFGTREIEREWTAKFPDPEERKEAMARQGWLLPLTDPKLVWLEAVPWRAIAFYGLLPPGVWDNTGVRPTNWRTEGLSYALQVGSVTMLLLASFIGLLFFVPGRFALFLLGAIGGHLAIIVFAGFSEPRVSYPVFPMHMLLAAAPFAMFGNRRIVTPDAAGEEKALLSPFKVGSVCAVILMVVVVVCRMQFGSAYAYRPLTAETVVEPALEIDRTLADLTCHSAVVGVPRKGDDFLVSPKSVRMRAVVTNYHFPVKYYGLASGDTGTALRGQPQFASDPSYPVYFEARLEPGSCPEQPGRTGKVIVGLAVEGATVSQRLRERDLIEFEGILQAERSDARLHWYWIAAKAVSVIESPSAKR